MYAVVGIWTLDEALRDEQLRALRDEIVPLTARTPGFLHGYWTHDPETGKAHTMIVFSSSQAAHNYKALVSSRSQAAARLGITSDILRTVDVITTAPDPTQVIRVHHRAMGILFLLSGVFFLAGVLDPPIPPTQSDSATASSTTKETS